jgi:uncharacterized membrane protein YoaK (UPF0700 family)
MNEVRDRYQGVAAATLCAAAGMADAIGYVNSDVFAANMTGNTVLVGLSLAEGQWQLALERASTVLAFMGGAIIGRSLLLGQRGRVLLPFLLEVALILGSAVSDARGVASVALIALAMGVQSTAMARFRGVAVSTVVVTSSIARLCEAFVDRYSGNRRKHVVPTTGAALFASCWLAYGAGAVLAGLLLKLSALSLVIPAIMVLVITLLLAWEERRRRHAAR